MPNTAPDDVSMALSFDFSLLPGEVALIDILISEDLDAIAPFTITHADADPGSTTTITYSGTATVVPEPGTFGMVGLGVMGLAAKRRGSGRT